MAYHLLLLVGRNPLPNAIAARVLAPGGFIHLIHSDATFPVAERLRQWIFSTLDVQDVVLHEVHEARPQSIRDGTKRALEVASDTDMLGLHYTGGTKAMAVHAYAAAMTWASREARTVYASYLDARSLTLRYDEPPPDQAQESYVGRQQILSFRQLVDLHGWTLDRRQGPRLAALSTPLAQGVSRDPQPYWNWKDAWGCDAQRHFTASLPVGPYDAFTEALSNTLGVAPGATLPQTEAANRLGFRARDAKAANRALKKYFDGVWLEEYTLSTLDELRGALSLGELHSQVEVTIPSPSARFEFDVVALRGPQLFALSCGAVTRPRDVKLKVFEAAVRARQMGGDQAATAVVCLADPPNQSHWFDKDVVARVEAEAQPVGGRPPRVFGWPDLAQETFTARLDQWIREVSNQPSH